MGRYLILCVFLLTSSLVLSQQSKKDSIAIKKTDSLSNDLKTKGVVVEEVSFKKQLNPLAPSKATFLSAIFPGAGQIYNKRYWKVPIVWGAIGSGILLYSSNNRQFNEFRDAFKIRRANLEEDPFFEQFSDDSLQTIQERAQENRDLSLLFTILLYTLNVVDANVDAHLKQFNVDNKLSMDFKPYLDYNKVTALPNYGMAILIKF